MQVNWVDWRRKTTTQWHARHCIRRDTFERIDATLMAQGTSINAKLESRRGMGAFTGLVRDYVSLTRRRKLPLPRSIMLRCASGSLTIHPELRWQYLQKRLLSMHLWCPCEHTSNSYPKMILASTMRNASPSRSHPTGLNVIPLLRHLLALQPARVRHRTVAGETVPRLCTRALLNLTTPHCHRQPIAARHCKHSPRHLLPVSSPASNLWGTAMQRSKKLDVSFLLNESSQAGGSTQSKRGASSARGSASGSGTAVDERSRCKICGHCFTQVGDMRKHMRTVHEGLRPYRCDMCERSFGENGRFLLLTLIPESLLTPLLHRWDYRKPAKASTIGTHERAPFSMQ